MYTGSTVPEGIGGSSLDQRSMPQPKREQEENNKKIITNNE
jgi:hypothetical protein